MQFGRPVELPAERPQPKRLPIKVALAANDGLPPLAHVRGYARAYPHGQRTFRDLGSPRSLPMLPLRQMLTG